MSDPVYNPISPTPLTWEGATMTWDELPDDLTWADLEAGWNAFYESVNRASDGTYSGVSRSVDDSYTQITRSST